MASCAVAVENAPPGQEGYYGAMGRSNISGSVECSHVHLCAYACFSSDLSTSKLDTEIPLFRI